MRDKPFPSEMKKDDVDKNSYQSRSDLTKSFSVAFFWQSDKGDS